MKIKRTIEVEATADEIAQTFAAMNSEDQAHFFNLVGNYFRNFDAGILGGLMQMEYMVWWDGILTDDGRWFISELAGRAQEEMRGLKKEEHNNG